MTEISPSLAEEPYQSATGAQTGPEGADHYDPENEVYWSIELDRLDDPHPSLAQHIGAAVLRPWKGENGHRTESLPLIEIDGYLHPVASVIGEKFGRLSRVVNIAGALALLPYSPDRPSGLSR